jgi:hypothetical protein
MSSQYTTPFEFTGESRPQVGPQRSDEPFTGLERHLATTFARDQVRAAGLAGMEARTHTSKRQRGQRDSDQRHWEKVDT